MLETTLTHTLEILAIRPYYEQNNYFDRLYENNIVDCQMDLSIECVMLKKSRNF